MDIGKIDRLIAVISHIERFIDDSYHVEIYECRSCVQMLKNEKAKIESVLIPTQKDKEG